MTVFDLRRLPDCHSGEGFRIEPLIAVRNWRQGAQPVRIAIAPLEPLGQCNPSLLGLPKLRSKNSPWKKSLRLREGGQGWRRTEVPKLPQGILRPSVRPIHSTFPSSPSDATGSSPAISRHFPPFPAMASVAALKHAHDGCNVCAGSSKASAVLSWSNSGVL